MSNMKALDLRKKTRQELVEILKSLKQDKEKLALEHLKSAQKNVKKMYFLKKDVARVLTILNEKEFLND